ncbi:Uncharacterized protein PECH_001148 [Penicillium ucsense]|uniref:Major facilitator superfamily (MFS) profile domain-containing protein n=1 Tax=Penicillium ucsense TaxID=2839758 RepID=A0A8J8W8L0_9EURO|nr:Uncharacterized protein PECM_000057 [Penicillium ucsense]KAF7733098.1 Uncharacterized protein PECH_001148 [Penicillium ucsense]
MVEQHAATDETRPLLGDESSLRNPACSQQKKFMILTMCAIFVLAADIGAFVSLAPETAIYERIICRNQGILSDSVDTPLVGVPPANPNDPCKSESVQAELALIKGYKDMFEVLPSILLSLPYGVLSDHWGRKPVLLLGIVGIVLGEMWIRLVAFFPNVFPLRLIWMSGLFRIIGGGDQTLVTIALVMVADVFSEEERTTALFRLQSCAIVAEILATPLSAWLMQFDYWLPYTLGFFIIVLGCTPSLFLPDTLQEAKANKTRWLEAANAASRETCDTVGIDSNVADANVDAPAKRSVLQEFADQAGEFVRSTQFIWRNISVLLIILSLLVAMLSRSSSIVLIQYVSKRFHWSIARSSLLISIRGVFTLLNYLVIMPGVSFAATQYLNMHGARRDYNITLGSGILMVLGFGLIGLAPLPPFLILGVITLSLSTAFGITARSLVTSLVAPDHVGTLYSAITISQSIGILVAGPLFAYLFRTGLHLGGGWMGLPFVQAGLLSFIATVAVACVRVPSPTCPAVEEEEHLLP